MQSNSTENITNTTGNRAATKSQGNNAAGQHPKDPFSPQKQSFNAQSSQKLSQYQIFGVPGTNTQDLGQLNAFNAGQAQQNKTQIFQSRSNSQQHMQSNMNPSLKSKSKIKQNQQLDGQISGLGNNGAALNKRATQKTQYDYDLTCYNDTNSSALGIHSNNGKNYSKKTNSGSVPHKYGSETRAQQDQKNQILSHVMPIFGSRNNHNASNTNPTQNHT